MLQQEREGNCVEKHWKDNLRKKTYFSPESTLNPHLYAFNCNVYLSGLVTYATNTNVLEQYGHV